MRLVLPLLCFILFAPLTLRAEYFLRGRVTEIDRQKGEITLVPLCCHECGPGGPPPAGREGKSLGLEADKNKDKVFIISADFIPPCVVPDNIIQVWGELGKENGNHVRAIRITGPGRRHGEDSTGVRSRLRKRCVMKPLPHGSVAP